MRPLAEREGIVACHGRTMDARCFWAIEEFSRCYPERTVGFVMQEWLEDEEWNFVRLLWVVDPSIGTHVILDGLARGVPLLVPAEHPALNDLCRNWQCGLSYRTDKEALLCLTLLLYDEASRKSLGERASAVPICVLSSGE